MADPTSPVVLGDGSDAFQPSVLAADLREVAGLYAGLRPYVGAAGWDAPSPESDWTMAQTVAHLDVMTSTGLSAVDDALHGRDPEFEGIEHRRGLTAWNEVTIEQRLLVADDPLTSLVEGLHRSADLIEALETEQLVLPVRLPIYNAPMTVVELWGIQTFHPGLTHSAQVTDAVDAPPLWTDLSSAARRRMITRLARALGYLYWPQRGGPDGVAIGIEIGGADGGSWHVIGDLDGGEGGVGAPTDPDLVLGFRDMATACRMFTGRLPMVRSLLRRDLRLTGDIRILRRFGQLFSADG